ncbi:MAG: protein kinase [Candidatus Xenobia bacterium]
MTEIASVLEVGARLGSRYVIKKVLSSAEDGAVYLVRQEPENQSRVIREMRPRHLDVSKLEERKQQFLEAVESVKLFDNPDVVRVLDAFSENEREYLVTEQVDGFNLEQIVQMSVHALPDNQVVPWARELCDTMAYLHARPRPFVFSALSPRRLMVLQSGRLKVVNLGLDTFFDGDLTPRIFAESEADRLRDFKRFGALLWFIATRQPLPEEGLPDAKTAKISPALHQVIVNCLNQEAQPVYKDWAEVKQRLDEVLNPVDDVPVAKKEADKPVGLGVEVPLLPWQEALVNAANRILSQPPFALVGEALVLLALIVGLTLWLNPSLTYHKSGPLTYAISGDHTLVAVNPNTGKVVARMEMKGEAIISSIRSVQGGRRLLAVDSRNDRVYVLDTSNNQVLMQFAVDAAPSQLVLSPDQKIGYCLHPRTHHLSEIDLRSFRLTNILSVVGAPIGLAFSPDGGTLYVSQSKPDAVTMMDADTGKAGDTIPLTAGAGPVAVTQDGKELWVASTAANVLNVYDATAGNGHNVIATVNDIGGKGPIAMQQTPDSVSMDILCRDSASVAVVKVADHSVQPAISLGGSSPAAWSFTSGPPRLWVTEPDANAVVVVDPLANAVVRTFNSISNPQVVEVAP